MKKSVAVILVVLSILLCFVGCEKSDSDSEKERDKNKIESINNTEKNTEEEKISFVAVTDGRGDGFFAATGENGNTVRDENGNLVVAVTNPDGSVVEKDGETVTEVITVESFIEIGNRYEMPEYSIEIPDGWKSSNSYRTLVLKEDGTENRITIVVTDNAEGQKSIVDSAIESLKATEGSKSGEEELTVHGTDGKLVYAFAEVEGDEHYVGFITFIHNARTVSVFIVGVEDMTDKIDDIVEIVDSIEFI